MYLASNGQKPVVSPVMDCHVAFFSTASDTACATIHIDFLSVDFELFL